MTQTPSHLYSTLPSTAAEVDQILADLAIETVFQPIVDLGTMATVGCEALSRGPVGSPLREPSTLFPAARAAGRLSELDLLCRKLALSRGARDRNVPPLLFINAEPGPDGSLSSDDEMLRMMYADHLPYQIVVEFTERDLTAKPGALLRYADEIRALGHLVAVDDVGGDPAPLAVVPLLRPEIIKLDMSLVQRAPSTSRMVVGSALTAYAEQTGAIILAEGVETEAHLRHAAAWGADWAQGFWFGRPGPIPEGGFTPVTGAERQPPPISRAELAESLHDSLFDVAAATGRVRHFSRRQLTEALGHIEAHGMNLGQSAVVMVRRPHVADLLEDGLSRCQKLAESTALLAVSTRGDTSDLPDAAVIGRARRGKRTGEWASVILGPHWAVACVARPEADGYAAVITYRDDLVQRIARMISAELDGPCDLPRHTSP